MATRDSSATAFIGPANPISAHSAIAPNPSILFMTSSFVERLTASYVQGIVQLRCQHEIEKRTRENRLKFAELEMLSRRRGGHGASNDRDLVLDAIL